MNQQINGQMRQVYPARTNGTRVDVDINQYNTGQQYPGQAMYPGGPYPPPPGPGPLGCGFPPPAPYPPFALFPNRFDDRCDRDRDRRGREGPQGPPGPVGPAGPQGPPGRVDNVSGSFEVAVQTVPADGVTRTVNLATGNFINGVTISGNALVFPRAGTYMITFNANVGSVVGVGDATLIFTATGAVSGAPNPLAQETVEAGQDDSVNVPFIINVPAANTTLSFQVRNTGALAATIQGGSVAAALIA